MHDVYNHILDSAFGLISTKPLNQIKVWDIVRASGVSKGTFYRYFKDKYDCISCSYVNVFFKPLEDNTMTFLQAFQKHADEIYQNKQTLKNIAQNDSFLLAFSDINDAYKRHFQKLLILKDSSLIDDSSCMKSINYFARTCAVTLYLYGNDKISNSEMRFFVDNLNDIVPNCLKDIFT